MRTTTNEQAFFNAFLVASIHASGGGLPMKVRLKDGEELSGIPSVEPVTAETMPYGQTVTLGHTPIIAQEVRRFCVGLPDRR